MVAKGFHTVKWKNEFIRNARINIYDGLQLNNNHDDIIRFVKIKEVKILYNNIIL